ncbi:hypothetical protein TSOC_005576 [Tetrabaena socialis]|uniref:Uncharacterized protein n=1 Tax=Tetrabaena socialis TaxID=47790 RepID=A0A2J8A5Y9_9CHLO|nr:hypothetical protein TSOC_005576 [Tetrabaena socialis]|eukprot:PNH07913.1 hypothetical protein TSOC_005576 [Tetrabaena socialis]
MPPVSKHGLRHVATDIHSEAERAKMVAGRSEPLLPAIESPSQRTAKAVGACLLWLACSSAIILVNKYIMVRRGCWARQDDD